MQRRDGGKDSRQPGNAGKNGSGSQQPPRRGRIPSWVIVALMISIAGWYAYSYFVPRDSVNQIAVPYSIFLDQVDSGNVAKVAIS
jgi:hypothetical protein